MPEPVAEIDVTPDLVQALLEGQHPDLAALPLRRVARGWDNDIYRLGEDLWGVFSLQKLARTPEFRQAAA